MVQTYGGRLSSPTEVSANAVQPIKISVLKAAMWRPGSQTQARLPQFLPMAEGALPWQCRHKLQGTALPEASGKGPLPHMLLIRQKH